MSLSENQFDNLDFKSSKEPFKIPKEWTWKPISQAIRVRKKFIQINDDIEYQRVTVQLYGRGIIPRDKIHGLEIRTKSQQTLNPIDFLVAEIDAKMGGFGIVPLSLANGIVSSHYFIFEINQEVLLPSFLEVFIRIGFITKSIENSVRGSLNYAAIRPRHILEIMFPFAPIAEQAEIGKRIEAVDKAISATQNQLEALYSLPGAIIRKFITQAL